MALRPTVAEIHKNALKYNYGQLGNKLSHTIKTMAVVKANAYGHGDTQIARILEEISCEYLGVALVEEGIKLRKDGIKVPIVVLSGIYHNQIDDIFSFDLTPVAYDTDTLTLINAKALELKTKKKVHIKIDTGMGRLGILPQQVVSFFQELLSMDGIEVDGLMSHFAEVEEKDKSYSRKQLDIFIKSISVTQRLGFQTDNIHMANSAGVIDFSESHFTMVRPGIMLYGAYPHKRFKDLIDLKPVMNLKTKILHMKKVPPGFSISYNRRFVTSKESTIATLPIGYGDGLPRRISEKGFVLIRGKQAPIVGTVCMDLIMVDVTNINDTSIGDDVVIFGKQGNREITVDDIAENCDTISYEILCNISGRVPRIVI